VTHPAVPVPPPVPGAPVEPPDGWIVDPSYLTLDEAEEGYRVLGLDPGTVTKFMVMALAAIAYARRSYGAEAYPWESARKIPMMRLQAAKDRLEETEKALQQAEDDAHVEAQVEAVKTGKQVVRPPSRARKPRS